MSECIFCKIINKQIPKEFTYEDESLVVFPDIHPINKVHLLVIPKKHIEDFLEITDPELVDKIRIVIQKLVKEKHLENRGYKLVVNGGGGQVVPHLHMHLIGPTGKNAAL